MELTNKETQKIEKIISKYIDETNENDEEANQIYQKIYTHLKNNKKKEKQIKKSKENKDLHKKICKALLNISKKDLKENENITNENIYETLNKLDDSKTKDENITYLKYIAIYAIKMYSKVNNEKIEESINYANEIYYKKNLNYGDSFGKCFEKYGIISTKVQLFHKIYRIKTLEKGEDNYYESIADNYLDIFNYSVMTLMELIKKDIEENVLK